MYAVSGVLPTPLLNKCRFKKWPSHLSHRRSSEFSTRLFLQGVAKVKEEARYEYLKDIGLDLARPWPKGLKKYFGHGNARFGISGINFFPFPGVQNNAPAYKMDLDQNVSRQLEV